MYAGRRLNLQSPHRSSGATEPVRGARAYGKRPSEKGNVMRFVYQMMALLLAAFPPWNVGGAAAMAQSGGLNQAGFEMYLPQLRAKALADGVSRSPVERVLPTLTFSPRTVQPDRAA